MWEIRRTPEGVGTAAAELIIRTAVPTEDTENHTALIPAEVALASTLLRYRCKASLSTQETVALLTATMAAAVEGS